MKVQKLVALKPFPFRGILLKVDDELEPDTKEQGDLLEAIGLAGRKKKAYPTRRAAPTVTSVMTARDEVASGLGDVGG